MKVIIAGGTGLIGSALTESFIHAQHQVVIVSRFPESTQMRFPSARMIGWETETLIREISGSDAVINLAGASLSGSNPLDMRWTPKRKASILNSRVQAGKMLVEAIQKTDNKPEVFFQASAIGFYGNKGAGIVDESSSAGRDYLAEVCQAWEDSTSAIEEMGVRRLIGRIGLVFSQDSRMFKLLKLPFSLYLGGQIGDGTQFLSWISIQDVVSSIRFLIDNHQSQGAYNLVSPKPLTNRGFARVLGSSMGRPVWLPIPEFALKIILGEASTLALDGRQVMPKRLLDAGYQFKDNQLDKFLPAIL
jgi:uncharacterized protein (TIGR01777 family)